MRTIKPKKQPKPRPDKEGLKEVMRPIIRQFVESGIRAVLANEELRPCFSRLCMHPDQADCIEAIAVAMCDVPDEEPVAS